VLAASALTAGLLWVVGLGCLAVATLGRFAIVARLGHWSSAVLRAHVPVPLAAGLVSVALLLFVGVSLGGAALRLVRGLHQLRRLHATSSPGRHGDLTIVHAPEPEAVALPGWPGSIMVTSGMLQMLDPAERAVLLAHERAHLRGAHWVFRLATRLGAALLPTVKPAVASCDRALERWADEAAAAEVGDRHLTARCVAKAALASTDYQRSALSLGIALGAVTERVQALLAPPRPSSWIPTLWLAAIATIGAAALLDAGRALDSLLDLAQRF
jgi:Zn-dependent protease with chaperone function